MSDPFTPFTDPLKFRWGFDYMKMPWHRPAFWVSVNFFTPFVSIAFLWWVIGFGKRLVFEELTTTNGF